MSGPSTRWRLSVALEDRPGAMNRMLAVFAARGVSLESLRAEAGDPARAELVFSTTPHRAAWFTKVVSRVAGVHDVDLAPVEVD